MPFLLWPGYVGIEKVHEGSGTAESTMRLSLVFDLFVPRHRVPIVLYGQFV